MKHALIAACILAFCASAAAQTPADPLAARLAAAQTELAADPSNGRAHLLAALAEADARSDLDTPAYAAAKALAQWDADHHQHDEARTAWAAAAKHAGGASDPDAARSIAEIYEAIAIWQGQGAHPHDDAATPARTLLNDAIQRMETRAEVAPPSNAVTDDQRIYALAETWSSIVPGDQPRPGTPYCSLAPMQDFSGYLSPRVLGHYSVLVVTARVVFDESGQAIDAAGAAAAPSSAIDGIQTRPFLRLHQVKDGNCTAPRVAYLVITGERISSPLGPLH